VAGDEQPVLVGLGNHGLDEGTVLRVADMQIADGQEAPGGTGRRRHVNTPAPGAHAPYPYAHTSVLQENTFAARGQGMITSFAAPAPGSTCAAAPHYRPSRRT